MRPLVLGIHSGHNAGAALLAGGRVLAAVSEERVSRHKNVTGYPRGSIELVLRVGGVEAKDLDRVALASFHTFDVDVGEYVRWARGEGPSPFPRPPGRRALAKWGAAGRLLWRAVRAARNARVPRDERTPPAVGPWEYTVYTPVADRKRKVSRDLGIEESRIDVVDHHLCHSAYAAYASPWRGEEARILVADQVGDYANATVWRVAPSGDLAELSRSYSLNSLGRIYSAVTAHLGMKPLEDEHKVMGLAPYARFEESSRLLAAFDALLAVRGLGFVEPEPPLPSWLLLPRWLAGARFDSVAGAVQLFLEKRLAEWAANAAGKESAARILFSGGVALNVKANRVVGDLARVERLHVPPAPGDESLAVGAAYATSIRAGLAPARVPPLGPPYLGDEFGAEEVRRAVAALPLDGRFRIREDSDPGELLARSLASGRIAARFSGRMEFGPRALGNRSILADASIPGVASRINARVKSRDFWMPFAPAILAERSADYVVNSKGLDASAMTLAFRGTPRAQVDLAGALHPADGTMRPQVVRRGDNPSFHELLLGFERMTGRGGLLNTSLNLHGEPIVRTPEEAVRTFERSDLDLLAFDDLVVERVREV